MSISKAGVVAGQIYMHKESEPYIEPTDAGIYIGRTLIYGRPFFYDPGRLFNPHIAVLGMSGVGKSYMVKSIVAKEAVQNHAKILIIDWNGEYGEFVAELGGVVIKPDDFGLESEIVCIDLSGLKNDIEREDIAKSLFVQITDFMHRSRPSESVERFIVMDEAWRLLKSSKEVGGMFREGRKYGTGMIIATQLASDIDREVISNSAMIAIFRLQNNSDYRLLVESGVVSEDEICRISDLPVGGCLLHISMKGAKGGNFVIERVDGPDVFVHCIRGVKMEVSLSETEFEKRTKMILGIKEAERVIQFSKANARTVDLEDFIKFLLLEHDRATIIAYLRELGLDDISIIRAAPRLVVN